MMFNFSLLHFLTTHYGTPQKATLIEGVKGFILVGKTSEWLNGTIFLKYAPCVLSLYCLRSDNNVRRDNENTLLRASGHLFIPETVRMVHVFRHMARNNLLLPFISKQISHFNISNIIQKTTKSNKKKPTILISAAPEIKPNAQSPSTQLMGHSLV